MIQRILLIAFLAGGAASVSIQGRDDSHGAPPLLSWSAQMAERERWLTTRHEMLLAMMRRQNIGMWIVVNEEFHADPLTEFVVPPRPYAGRRDVYVFTDTGDQGLKKVAIENYGEEQIARFFETPDSKNPEEVLRSLFDTYQPRTIALGTGGNRGVTRSLTHDSYLFLSAALGPEATKRFVSAAPLIEEYLDTRIPDEFDDYTTLVELTESVVKQALSADVIKPGTTTVGDVRRWLYNRLWSLGVGTWFQPDLRVQRKGSEKGAYHGFLAVAKEAVVIERGDLLHVDFGISYMGLHSDWQKMAYVLGPGEPGAPAGLKKALANTNALQDALMLRASRPGRNSADVYEMTMTEMQQKGIEAQVYCHPLGNQGHALGAAIDFRSASRNEEPQPLRKGSYISIELNTQTPVPEWDGQKVYIMEEDPAYLTDEGWKFFRPRQEELYVIK